MLRWILGAFAAGYVCKAVHNRNFKKDYNHLRVTFNNHMSLLANYDKVNRYAKRKGFGGAVDFFYYLANNHDSRFEHFARFLNKVRHIRNDVAHNGVAYDIDQRFLDKLDACVKVCYAYDRLPKGRILYLD